MSEITLNSTVVRASDVMASPVDNELVMMDIERGVYYSLDRVGADIWKRLAEPLRVADLCDQLMQEYEVDRTTCETDVLAVLNEMAADGLLAEA
jgi:Coenzyme PQQ synthesis protein D (PqqD)